MLMDFFLTLHYKPNDLRTINQCRLYHQVYSLTDITSADGRIIVPDYKVGIRSPDRKSDLKWPTQQRPSKKAVRIYHIYYLIRSNAADGQRTADG
jgi:hypothetical protein